MNTLTLRLALLMGIFFGILFIAVSLLAGAMGVGNIYVYLVLAVIIIGIQYLTGPKLVELTMRVKYIDKNELGWLHEMVEELARKANIPTPRIGISFINVPNAFAFGRSIRDGRVCVTKEILNLLSRDELKAVLGHEISHIKNRDVLFVTALSVLPLILYWVFLRLTFFGSYRRRSGSGYEALIGLGALLLYFITNLLVLYASRIREYFADKGSVDLGNAPSALATALYKLVYGAAKSPKEQLQEVEGVKAFFLNDVSKARREIRDLAQLDLDHSGTIDPYELRQLQRQKIRLTLSNRLMEAMSTHPNMLKRIKNLSQYSRG